MVPLPLAADGTFITVAVAERLDDHPDLAAVMVFMVGGGDTRLVAHAVVPAPPEWGAREHAPGTHYDAWLTVVGWKLIMTGEQDADLARLMTQTQLTTRILRGVTTGGLERWARQRIAADPEIRHGLGVSPGGDRKHRKPNGGGDRRLAELASRYVDLLSETDAPNRTLADEFGISLNTVSSYLFRARERGLLTSAGRGRAGGALTERAVDLLADHGSTT